MSWNTIRIDPADRDFSRWLRLQRKQCERCGKKGTGVDGITGLQASHFHSRKKWSTRFDPYNVDCLCISCHQYFTEHKIEYKEWKLKRLGQDSYDILELSANTTGKRDFKMARIVWKQILKDLEN